MPWMKKVRQNLVDAGCSEGFIDDYAAAGSGSEQLCRLRQHRKKICSAAYMTASASSIVLII